MLNRPTVPPGLIVALDGALDSGTRMRPEHIAGVLDWLHELVATNVDNPVSVSVDELVLVAHALGDAIGAPIASLDTDHVRNVVAILPDPTKDGS